MPDTPVVIIAGNHDTPRSTETGTILKLFEAIDGVHVASHEVRTFEFEDLETQVVSVPHAALVSGPEAIPVPRDGATYNILVVHGEVDGVLNRDASALEYGGVIIKPENLSAEWDFVALGHYHVARPVAMNAWYSGSLDYVSTNPWGELVEEEAEGRRGEKGWLLVELGGELEVTFKPVNLERRVLDLPRIKGQGLGAAELDRLIAARLDEVTGGITDDVVRQVVLDVPRTVVRDLDHKFIRDIKAEALHYNLDIRRPSSQKTVGIGSPGRRQTLAELVEEHLEKRTLADDVDRRQLVELGRTYMDEVERDLLED